MKTVPYPAFEFSGQPCSVCNRENTVFPSLSLKERGKWSNVCIGCEATNPPKPPPEAPMTDNELAAALAEVQKYLTPIDHGPLTAMLLDEETTDPDPVVGLFNSNGYAVYQMPLSVYQDLRNLKINGQEAEPVDV